MSQSLIRKWLKKAKDDDEEIGIKVDQKEVADIFSAIETTLKSAFSKNIEEGGRALAQIHHNLLESAVLGGSEKGRLSLLFLKSKLESFIDEPTMIGSLLVAYSRHWLRLILILESQAYNYLSWISCTPEEPLPYEDILENLNNVLPLEDDLTSVSPNRSVTEMLGSYQEKDSTKMGQELQAWIYSVMRQVLEGDEQSLLLLGSFQAVFPTIIAEDFVLNEVVHEFAKAWFRSSLQLKRWFNTFGARLPEDVRPLLSRGYYWSKLSRVSDQPLSKALKNHLTP